MNNFNDSHPEKQDGEIFLTNSDIIGYPTIGWKSKRKGVLAYTINGEPIKWMFPVFVQKDEYDEGMKKYKKLHVYED